MKTMEDLVNFVEQTPREFAFPGCSRSDLIEIFKASLEDNGLSYFVDGDNKIIGVMIFRVYPNEKLVWLQNILLEKATRKQCMKRVFEIYKKNYDGWRVQSLRHGKFVIWEMTPRVEKFFLERN